jgi:hypothetical protein
VDLLMMRARRTQDFIIRIRAAARREAPLWLALALVGFMLGGLLVGYEPIGGDPDRLYRPLKSELSRSLQAGTLPFWSERFGLGVPLVAESHVAAFYPLNIVLYRVFDLSAAYRLSMWLHYVALVGTTYGYARSLKLSSWGSAVAGVAFALCGFQAIHSSHEPFYCVMPYLPLALLIAELYMASGRALWLALLSLCMAIAWMLGHFQIQAWTAGLVILTGLWRSAIDGRPWRRALGLVAAMVWGCALSAVQLGPSWQFANLVGHTQRSARELFYYSFPAANWFDLVLPQLIRELQLGPTDPYWRGLQTEGYEIAFYIGTIPLILAFLALCARPFSRPTLPWKIMIPISFVVATMPQWWGDGYMWLISIPGVGYFRVPARYTLLCSLGLAVLAGEGLDLAISSARFRVGLISALAFAIVAVAAATFWTFRPDVHLRRSIGGLPGGFLWCALAWSSALVALLAWRSGKIGPWALVVISAVELGALFYHGTTDWGWAIELPGSSRVLTELAAHSPRGLIGGETGNLPVRLGFSTGHPYLGFAHAPFNRLLLRLQDQPLRGADDLTGRGGKLAPAHLKRWLRRWRVSFVVGYHPEIQSLGKDLGHWHDPTLDFLAAREPLDPEVRDWSIVELAEPFPEARVALRVSVAATIGDLLSRFTREDDLDTAWFLSEDNPPIRPEARSARLVSWDGTSASVEHDGPCDLVVARSFDPGWTAQINGGPPVRLLRVDGGYQGVRLEKSGRDSVVLAYQPPGWRTWLFISTVSAVAVILVFALSLARRMREESVAADNGRLKG